MNTALSIKQQGMRRQREMPDDLEVLKHLRNTYQISWPNLPLKAVHNWLDKEIADREQYA